MKTVEELTVERNALRADLEWIGRHLTSLSITLGGNWRMEWEGDDGKSHQTEYEPVAHSKESYGEMLQAIVEKAIREAQAH